MSFYRVLNRTTIALALGGLCSFAQTMAIVNGASFNPGGPVAPGSFASMFGATLCPHTASAEWIAPGQLPTELEGCSITVNGTPAMLHYVSPHQINFIVPEGLAPGRANVSLHSVSTWNEGTMMIGESGPGVFATTGMGTGTGAVLHSTTWRTGPFSVTTNGEPTHLAIYMTGLNPSVEPLVSIAGTPVTVTWYGNAPGFAGLQQINIRLPGNFAGAGMVPLTVTSGGETSNVTYINLLPTTEMMQRTPGWNSGMMVGENTPRASEISDLAYNPSNHTALVCDEEADVLRLISMDTMETRQTITLPESSNAGSVALNAEGTMAAVGLPLNASVALINLQDPEDTTIVGTGSYPSHLAFAGANLFVTNTGSGTVTVIDWATRNVIRTIVVGFGPDGIAADGKHAVVSNMQGGTLSVIDLTDYSVTSVGLPAGTRPHDVALSTSLGKAVITTPMSNGFLLLDLATKQFTQIGIGSLDARGPGAVAILGSRAYIANQMSSTVTEVDLLGGAVVNTFPVDPGSRAMAADPAHNQLILLSQSTGALSVVELNGYTVVGRVNATEGTRAAGWTLPAITLVTPASAHRGTTFSMSITGSNLQDVQAVEFFAMAGDMGPGGGMGGTMPTSTGIFTPMSGMGTRGMGPGGMGGNVDRHDPNITATGLQSNADGTRITLTVTVLANASTGSRRIAFRTSNGLVMGGPMFNNWFTVTP